MNSSRLFPFSQKVDYGLFLLTRLTKSKKPISLNTIAQENYMSFYFLQKIARQLRKGNLIESTRGKEGGYELKRKPEDISLKEIIECLEGPIAIVPCLRNFAPTTDFLCKREKYCMMKDSMRKMNTEMENILLEKNLNSFIA